MTRPHNVSRRFAVGNESDWFFAASHGPLFDSLLRIAHNDLLPSFSLVRHSVPRPVFRYEYFGTSTKRSSNCETGRTTTIHGCALTDKRPCEIINVQEQQQNDTRRTKRVRRPVGGSGEGVVFVVWEG